MTNLENIINEMNLLESTLKHLNVYQTSFKYGGQSEEDWKNLQETINELSTRKTTLQKEKFNLENKKEIMKWKKEFGNI